MATITVGHSTTLYAKDWERALSSRFAAVRHGEICLLANTSP